MDDAPVVCKLQRVAQWRHDSQRLLRREFPRAQKLAQVHTVHEFHEQVIKSAGLSEVINGDDVRMVQRGEGLRLARKTFGKLRVAHAFRRQKFQRHKTIQGLLPRLIDHAHAAASETFKDFKLWKVRGDLFGRQWRLRGGRVAGENGFCFQVQRHEAARTKTFRRVRRQRRAAVIAFFD
jgi:hypothetical protein